MPRLASPNRTKAGALDDPATTTVRRAVLARKRFLRKVYDEWYREIADAVPPGEGRALEIGAGAGFLSEYLPGLITSEVLLLPGVSIVLDGCRLPFRDGSLKAILMTDVLHHIPTPRRFFSEAARCLRSGGVVAMVEPWRTFWSELVYRNLHHEPFEPAAAQWEFPSTGPLSSANGALPWILFERDRRTFEREFPEWRIENIRRTMPFRYLLSGGFSGATFQPGFTFGFWKAMERAFRSWAMFAYITLRRR
jgi:SAM-dependent methyltransferase